jgi:hypothetical protein
LGVISQTQQPLCIELSVGLMYITWDTYVIHVYRRSAQLHLILPSACFNSCLPSTKLLADCPIRHAVIHQPSATSFSIISYMTEVSLLLSEIGQIYMLCILFMNTVLLIQLLYHSLYYFFWSIMKCCCIYLLNQDIEIIDNWWTHRVLIKVH